MRTLLRTSAIISSLAFLAIGASTIPSSAQGSYGNDNNNCPSGQDNCYQGSQNPDQGNFKKHKVQKDNGDQGDQGVEVKSNSKVDVQVSGSDKNWKYDPNRMDRRRHKDAKFRFEFNGFWYPEPYWTYSYGYGIPGRFSCGAGRELVADHGFYRVRPVECVGRTYTYLGRRHGATFQIIVSSRSGRIIDINRI